MIEVLAVPNGGWKFMIASELTFNEKNTKPFICKANNIPDQAVKMFKNVNHLV